MYVLYTFNLYMYACYNIRTIDLLHQAQQCLQTYIVYMFIVMNLQVIIIIY